MWMSQRGQSSSIVGDIKFLYNLLTVVNGRTAHLVASAPPVWIGRSILGHLETCKRRTIGDYGIETPLLVPSFSSTTFSRASDVRVAIEFLRPQIATCSLVSALDIHRGFVDEEIGYSDLVIVDSGNYEKRAAEGLGYPVEWSPINHASTIARIVPLTRIAVVNYDQPGPFGEQVKAAAAFFGKHPKFLSDFLCKPLSARARSKRC